VQPAEFAQEAELSSDGDTLFSDSTGRNCLGTLKRVKNRLFQVDRMEMPIFLFILLLHAASAKAEMESDSCPGLYAWVATGLKRGKDTAAKGWTDFQADWQKEGPKALLVKRRGPEELAKAYSDYFFPTVPEAEEKAGRMSRALERVAHFPAFSWDGKRRTLAPLGGTFDAFDRAFLGDYSARLPYKMVAELAAGAYTLDKLVYDPLDEWGKKKEFENAVTHAVNEEYTYRTLHEDIREGRSTRQEAEEIVRTDLRTRKAYFELVNLLLAKDPGADMESIAPQFARMLDDPKMKVIFEDLRRYLSPQMRKSPLFHWRDPEKKITLADYRRLFALNHLKAYGNSILPKWLDKGFDTEKLRKTDPAGFEIYKSIMHDPDDPFQERLVALRNSGRISQEKLEWLSQEFLETRIRYESMAVLGVEIRNKEGKTLTLADREAEIWQREKLYLPGE
jgi:hypothetical protein